ncbi:MAG: PDGLE domain-containing protein, partial [Rhodoferax sp.]
ALAGYLAINAAALLAALEFGLQPLLFHDAAGAPLYAPYPLAIALPAMMLGHLGVAGLAELLLSAGLLSYLQRAHPELLALGAQGAASHSDSAWRSTTRRLWYGLAALLMLTPLGLLAGGTAWGEWHLQQFASAEGRTAIAQASGQTAAPAQAPVGMEQLAAWWQAPMPDYAPPFLQHTGLGYLLSAMFGVGLIVLLFLLLSGVRAKARRHG